ncbi:c-type cytochrome [Pseudenhygromyxa sp. WMMC2535]|uniref:c-type cytochrome n=1 Tax=Pseudenhygromyxa sp. WMMC2535 TaxID=2712867 RepID=UPI001553771D|nr:cytochrome c [Pseudenhygromyxa sp. WMMC2535]NVB36524.1 c-type cytochrome [Pseudenhygromyxa sp. WMMC2535]
MSRQRQHRKPLVGALAGLVLAGAVLASGCQGNRSDKPPVHIIWNMDFQQKFDPQERNPFYEDGRAARLPVEGTIARGELKTDTHLYEGRGLDGLLVDELPKGMELSAELLDRGEERFNIYCAPCHGQDGQGEGPATRRGGGFKVPPANLHKKELQPAPMGHFYDVIANGKGTMLPYAAQIPVTDRWAIVAWVRALQAHGRTKGWDKDKMPATAAANVPAANEPAAKEEGEG